MFRRLIVALLLTAPAGAALAQNNDMGEWALAAMPNGCMVQATSPQGTMLSIWGFAGEEKLAFLLQNRDWNSLRDGAHYDLKLDFLGVRSLPVEATARREIDQDGPGFFFTVQPGAQGGTGFLDAFSSAEGMRVSPEGESGDVLPLAGSRGAMGALARCLADRYAEVESAQGQGGPEEPEDETGPAGVSI